MNKRKNNGKFTLGDVMPEKFLKYGTTLKNRRNKARRKEKQRKWREEHPETAMDVIKNLSDQRKRNKK